MQRIVPQLVLWTGSTRSNNSSKAQPTTTARADQDYINASVELTKRRLHLEEMSPTPMNTLSEKGRDGSVKGLNQPLEVSAGSDAVNVSQANATPTQASKWWYPYDYDPTQRGGDYR